MLCPICGKEMEQEGIACSDECIRMQERNQLLPSLPPTYFKTANKVVEEKFSEGSVLIIIGLIGGILLLVGILMFFGGSFGQGVAELGLTLAVIGFIILFFILTIASKGECCAGCA